jgi:2-dehydro-3-deoxyglucarate aldolase
MKNKFREALLGRKLTLGAWMQIGHPAIAEIFARNAFDWICVDIEHGAIDIETMTNIFRTVERYDCVPVARIPLNDPVWIHRSLDAGARGLIIPMIKTAQEAEQAIKEAKYPPRGIRGYGYSRANMHGIDFEEYIKAANDEIAMVMQIEHKDAITNLDDIVKVDGVDGVFIGPLDLSGSMGITGQMNHPDMTAALDKYRKIASKANKSFGMHIVRPNQKNVKANLEQGYTMIAIGLDNVFIDEMSKTILNEIKRINKNNNLVRLMKISEKQIVQEKP